MFQLTGKTLGRYHVVEPLGEGGMAKVYKAFDAALERYVAIKVIRSDGGSEENFLHRFHREARALAQLDHPNILKVLDYGEQDGVPFLVMPFVTGGTLKERMGRPYPTRGAAHFLAPVARALEYAHQQGIIHRDVKPANILITQSGAAILSDFGIAKMLETKETSQLTATGVGIGTPDYMAPEQWLGETNPRTDIYALGVVFYEMITGRRPYTADTPAAVLLKHMQDPLPRPRDFVADIPDSAERVVFRALAKDPAARYADMGQLAEALERLAVEAPNQAPVSAETVDPAGAGVASRGERIPTGPQGVAPVGTGAGVEQRPPTGPQGAAVAGMEQRPPTGSQGIQPVATGPQGAARVGPGVSVEQRPPTGPQGVAPVGPEVGVPVEVAAKPKRKISKLGWGLIITGAILLLACLTVSGMFLVAGTLSAINATPTALGVVLAPQTTPPTPTTAGEPGPTILEPRATATPGLIATPPPSTNPTGAPITSIAGFPDDLPILTDNNGDLTTTTSADVGTVYMYSSELDLITVENFFRAEMGTRGWTEDTTQGTHDQDMSMLVYLKENRQVLLNLFRLDYGSGPVTVIQVGVQP